MQISTDFKGWANEERLKLLKSVQNGWAITKLFVIEKIKYAFCFLVAEAVIEIHGDGVIAGDLKKHLLIWAVGRRGFDGFHQGAAMPLPQIFIVDEEAVEVERVGAERGEVHFSIGIT